MRIFQKQMALENFHNPLPWLIFCAPLKMAGVKPTLAGWTFSLLRLPAMTIHAAPTRTVPGELTTTSWRRHHVALN